MVQYVIEGSGIVAVEEQGNQIRLDPPVPVEELDELRSAVEYLNGHLDLAALASVAATQVADFREWGNGDDDLLSVFIGDLTPYQRAFYEVLAERGEQWTPNPELVRLIAARTGGRPLRDRATAGIRAGITKKLRRIRRQYLEEFPPTPKDGHWELRLKPQYVDMVRRALA